jgi:hypothetical protein
MTHRLPGRVERSQATTIDFANAMNRIGIVALSWLSAAGDSDQYLLKDAFWEQPLHVRIGIQAHYAAIVRTAGVEPWTGDALRSMLEMKLFPKYGRQCIINAAEQLFESIPGSDDDVWRLSSDARWAAREMLSRSGERPIES